MPTLQASRVGDVIAGTLKELGEDHFSDLTSDLQNHVAYKELLNDHKTKVDSGYECQFNLMVGNNDGAKWIGLNEVDNVNMIDVMKQGSVPWRHITANMAIEERLVTMNGTPRRIFNIVKTAKTAAMIGYIEKMEIAFWGKPADSTDEKLPFGLKYWVTMVGATTTVGFNGGDPTGFAGGAAGILTAAYPRWKNCNGIYTAVSKDDLVPKMRKAARLCDFKPPVDMPVYKAGEGFGYYMGLNVLQGLEIIGENQNDRLGTDLAPMDGEMTFKRSPLKWAPALDADTTLDPVYGLYWGSIECKYLAGEWMKQTGPKPSPLQHRTLWTHWDTSMNFLCTNRRRNFVLGKTAA